MNNRLRDKVDSYVHTTIGLIYVYIEIFIIVFTIFPCTAIASREVHIYYPHMFN